jgi:hypothetical protein
LPDVRRSIGEQLAAGERNMSSARIVTPLAAPTHARELLAETILRQIVVECETIGDSRTMFRLLAAGFVIAENLTAVQVHLLVGEMLDRIAVPRASESDESRVALAPRRAWEGDEVA